MADLTLAEAVVRYSDAIDTLVEHRAGGLSRREALEDLAQGAKLRMLGASGSFEWLSEPQFLGWARTVVESYLNSRRDYWNAARRNAGHVLRITLGSESTPRMGVDPRSLRTGPATFADRRDQMHLATQAMAMLLDRDQLLLELDRRGASLEEIGRELGLTAESAGRARLRAQTRFHRAFELLLRAR